MTSNLFKRGFQFEDSGGALSDWKGIIDEGTLIFGTANVNNTTSTLYTVPTGKIAYITSFSLGYNQQGTTFASVLLKINDTNALTLIAGQADELHGEIAFNPAIPIKLTEGQTLKISSPTANLWVSGSFTGYEVKV